MDPQVIKDLLEMKFEVPLELLGLLDLLEILDPQV
jgi:hypothetical protein